MSYPTVSTAKAEPRKSLEAAKDLFNLTRAQPSACNVRTILAAALVQNGYDSKALEAVGSLKQMELAPEKLLIAAVAKANLNEKEASAELYKRGQKALDKVPDPRSRLQEIAIRLAESLQAEE